MKIRLPENWIQKLIKLPESGMGVQHVDIFLNEGRVIRNVAVFNCEELSTNDVFETSEIVDIKPTAKGDGM